MKNGNQVLSRVILLATMILVAFPVAFFAEAEKDDYKGMMKEVNSLFRAKKIDEALSLLESGLVKFPEKEYRISSNLAFLYVRVNKIDKMVAAYELGHTKGYYYPFYLDADPWKTLMAKNEKFKKMIKVNDKLLAKANKDSKPKYTIVEPSGYSPEKKYPVFIALHGWGGNGEFFQGKWKSETLKDEFIVAYIRSSQLVGVDSYGWNDVEKARKEVGNLYAHLKDKYSIDESRILVGGFSQGGKTAMGIAVNNVIPATGFIALVPGGGIKDELSEEALKAAIARGVKGAIITGTKDHNLPAQEEAVKYLREMHFPVTFSKAEKLSHWFPEDFGKRLDNGIKFVLEKKEIETKK